jgi:outer membrane protein
MKRIIAIITLMSALSAFSFAQKYAIVDTDYILKNIPSYKAAQDKIDQLTEDWQKEIKTEQTEIEKLYKEFQAERVLLTDEMRQQKEKKIVEEEKKLRDLQRKYFGTEGELYEKQQELIKPIQDEVYSAIKELSSKGGYAIVFDSSAGASILYTDPKYDKSDEVLRILGYKN